MAFRRLLVQPGNVGFTVESDFCVLRGQSLRISRPGGLDRPLLCDLCIALKFARCAQFRKTHRGGAEDAEGEVNKI